MISVSYIWDPNKLPALFSLPQRDSVCKSVLRLASRLTKNAVPVTSRLNYKGKLKHTRFYRHLLFFLKKNFDIIWLQNNLAA